MSSVLERLGSATPRDSVAKNRLLIIGIVALVLVLGGWLIFAFTQPESSTLWPVDLAVYRDGGLIVRQLGPYNAKLEATARLSLDALGLVPDAVFGGVHGPEKAAVLSSVGATVYVGDTPADIAAAVTAGARPVGVATGSFTGDELRAAGAVDVLASLREFPTLYQSLIT